VERRDLHGLWVERKSSYKGKMGIIYSGVKDCIEQRACHTSVFVYDEECLIKHKGNDLSSQHMLTTGVLCGGAVMANAQLQDLQSMTISYSLE